MPSRSYLVAERPERCFVGQDTAPILVLLHNGTFVPTNYGHHVAKGAIPMHLANEVRCRCDVVAQVWPIHVPSMDEIPIGQIIVAPNFSLSNPLCYEHHVAILVLLLPKPKPPHGTLLPCPLPGGGTLMDSVHNGCLLEIHVAIGPTGGESLHWVCVDAIVHVGKGFTKGPGVVFGLRRALTFALWRALTFALRRGSAFALQRGLTFALQRGLAFAV